MSKLPLRSRESIEDAFRARRTLRGAVSSVTPQDREDVIQDAVVKTIEAGDATPLESTFAYLVRATRTTVIDRFRRRAVRSALHADLTDDRIQEIADQGPDPERGAIASDRLRRAMACIEGLPPKRKQVFILARIEGLTYPQIAKRLGISPRTVEHQIRAAMVQISRELDRDGPAMR